MPTRLPVSDLLSGLVRSLMRAIGCWIHYTAVACAWLGFVPLVTCRIYYSLFSGSVQRWKLFALETSILTLPISSPFKLTLNFTLNPKLNQLLVYWWYHTIYLQRTILCVMLSLVVLLLVVPWEFLFVFFTFANNLCRVLFRIFG